MASVNIGQTLKEERLRQNLSLDALQKMTKIQKRYLMAIEENEFDEMPGTFYVRTFIRQYANAVGLDSEELVASFDGKDIQKKAVQLEEPETLNRSRTQLYEEERSGGFMKSIPAIIFSMIGLAIVIVVVYITWQDAQTNPVIKKPVAEVSVEPTSGALPESTESVSTTSSETTESSTTDTTVNMEKPVIQYIGEQDSVVNMSVTEAKAPLKFEFTGKNAAGWVGVYYNSTEIFQSTLQVGEKQSVEIPENMLNVVVVLGASGNTNMTLNGEAVNFNPNNLAATRKDIVFTIAYAQTLGTDGALTN